MDEKTRKLAIRLGASIRALRQKAGISQVQLGQTTGMDQAYVSRIEAGKVEPCLGTLRTLSEALGVTLSELFRGL
jgi:transcriptional regulator with XRE-family HTH domain